MVKRKTRESTKVTTLKADSTIRVVRQKRSLTAQPIIAVSPMIERGRVSTKRASDSGDEKRVRTRRCKTQRTTSLVAHDDEPRLASGLKVVRNPASSRDESITHCTFNESVPDEIRHKQLFTEFEAAFIVQDIGAIGACLSPAFQWHLPNGMVVYGKHEALDEMQRRFAMPNGPKFSNSVWRFKGSTVIQTYDVSYCGPDGRWRESKGMDLYDIGADLITRKDAYWKMIP